MVVMIVPQKKAAEDISQWLVKFSRRLLTSRPASTADTTPCSEGRAFIKVYIYPLTYYKMENKDLVFPFIICITQNAFLDSLALFLNSTLSK